MTASTNDKLVIGAALLLALGSAAGFGVMVWRHVGFPSGAVPTVELSSANYEPRAAAAPAVKTETWAAPVAQSRGREWIYDTFTPPEIFYNARSRQFTVKPPSSLVEEDTTEAFGIELVSVRPEPYRLQLIGYVGGDGNWRGTFLNTLSGEVFLAAAGRRVPNLGLSIKSLDVRPQPIRVGENTTSHQRVATAVIRDDKTGRDVTLTHRERHFTGEVFAFLSTPGETATREVRQGDTFKIGDATYRVEAVRLSPPSVEIVKEAPTLSQPDRRTLTPREVEAPEIPERDATS